jgi:hypothetical protein
VNVIVYFSRAFFVSQYVWGLFGRMVRVHTLKIAFCASCISHRTTEAVFNIPYRNVKGVWWMPRLSKAMKDVVWLR